MLIRIHPKNPEPRKIYKVIQCLKDGGVIIYPTDTVYGIGCDFTNKNAIERICKLKKINTKKQQFSFVCYDLSDIAKYTKSLSTPSFKIMKNNLPGPYTFILHANSKIPKFFKNKKKEVGIRVPHCNISRNIVKGLKNPIVSTSLKDEDTIIEYASNPEHIYDIFKKKVDMVIDGGFLGNTPSTVIDLTSNQPKIIRKGKGPIYQFH